MTERSAAQVMSLRKRVWGWWFFDWASQPYHTLLVTFVFGPFFAATATQYFLGTGLGDEAARAQAQFSWSLCLTITGLIIGICAPFIGALADIAGRKMPWIVGFSVAYVLGSAGLWFMDPGGSNMWWMLVSFGIGFIGAEFALIFINAQLPTLGSKDEIGQVSGSGFAFGYLGGVISLFIMLLLFVEQDSGKTLIGIDPILGLDANSKQGTRAVGPFVAVWFIVFMIPYFSWVRDPHGPSRAKASLGRAVSMVVASVKGLKQRKSLTAYLVSSMLYRDALNGLYSFGGVYAGLVLDWSITQIGIFGIVAAISAAGFSWVGGLADRRFGPKPVIGAAIAVLSLVCLVVVNMSRTELFGIALADGSGLPDQIFFGCGVLIGGFGGILQATSRTLMVRHTRPETATEAFGLYGLSGRATAFLAPALIGLVTTLTGNARLGLTPVIALFALGLLLLSRVDGEGDQV
ncbi:MFS transporter [Tritonibacter horizontis]|uniref:Vacuole effluxer Atg22 like protein n=1 Tax=Tritonibacter horizontis TaxID=1768241 RepID=A0A132C163_9RHOB|nr:MFS transporter [Tritonibacter horizontis]KUP94338.1 vacuole effluxer Atg22 like protein [Tritonibacter horizontis]